MQDQNQLPVLMLSALSRSLHLSLCSLPESPTLLYFPRQMLQSYIPPPELSITFSSSYDFLLLLYPCTMLYLPTVFIIFLYIMHRWILTVYHFSTYYITAHGGYLPIHIWHGFTHFFISKNFPGKLVPVHRPTRNMYQILCLPDLLLTVPPDA